MTTTTTDTRSGRQEHQPSAGGGEVSLPRLYVLRAGYLLVGGGLAITHWPSFFRAGPPWPLQ